MLMIRALKLDSANPENRSISVKRELAQQPGEVLESADSLDLESSVERRGGSNPPFPTKRKGNDIASISLKFQLQFQVI